MKTNRLSPATHRGLYAGVRKDFNQGVSAVLVSSFADGDRRFAPSTLSAAETTLQKMLQLAYEAGVERGFLFAERGDQADSH